MSELSRTLPRRAGPAERRGRSATTGRRAVTASVAALGAVLCTAVVACAPAVAMQAPAPLPVDPSVPAALLPFYQQQLAWGPCTDFATSEMDRATYADPTYDCTRVEVPIDYADPQSGTAQIGLLRQRAGGEKIGSLLFNPGGPGGSGMSFVGNFIAPGLGGSPLSQRFDLIGFDPRGVGSSTPTIDCLSNEEWDAERADVDFDPSPAGVAEIEAENREYVEQCIQRSGGATFLANIGTRDVARDLDIIRHALGDEKLNYLGYSYGTSIGTAYAEAFPQNVRALVLDGAIDPTETATESAVKQAAGFQLAFDAFAADCASRPDCPLGQDPAQTTAAWQALIRPLIDAPLPVGDRVLTYSDATTGVVQALYGDALWPDLAAGLQALRDGDGSILLALADFYLGRELDGSYSNETEAFLAISCMDQERITDRAQIAELERMATQAAPFADPGIGPVGALDACAFWPAEPTSLPHVPTVDGLPPTLVVSVTGDPATPYQAGVNLTDALGGSLISVEGNQHTASLQGNACIDDVVTSYLVELTVPAEQTNCTI
jgi:pimeloyl-ACP methyl ester carboxylesterase